MGLVEEAEVAWAEVDLPIADCEFGEPEHFACEDVRAEDGSTAPDKTAVGADAP